MSSETSGIAQLQADKQKVTDVYKCADYLTAWESTFLGSIKSRLDKNYALSEKQRDVLDKLVAKAAERFD